MKQFIFPIFDEHDAIIGQGFIADGLFLTAAHVLNQSSAAYIFYDGHPFVFAKEEPLLIGPTEKDYKDASSLDVAVFSFKGAESPLNLSDKTLENNATYTLRYMKEVLEVLDDSDVIAKSEIKEEVKNAQPLMQTEGNYFYCDCVASEGTSGSPLLNGGDVVGIMHGGDGKGLCAFLSMPGLIKEINAHLKKSQINIALGIATKAYAGHNDKHGYPLVLHALAIGLMGESEEEKAVGFLYNVVQATEYTFEELIASDLSQEVKNAIMLLTHENGCFPREYIERIINSGDDIALNVKHNEILYFRDFCKKHALYWIFDRRLDLDEKIEFAWDQRHGIAPTEEFWGEIEPFIAECIKPIRILLVDKDDNGRDFYLWTSKPITDLKTLETNIFICFGFDYKAEADKKEENRYYFKLAKNTQEFKG